MRPFRLQLLLALSLSGLVTTAAAKDDWQAELHKWAVSNDTNPVCKVRYTTGLYRSDLGDQPAWGMMTEKMFKWFSKDGVKLAPSVCPASRNTKDKVAYRILFSVSPMKTVSRTTHGSEVKTVDQPFSANVNSRTSSSDGRTANSTATINGEQTTTVVVPTETTVSQSSVSVYMYTYRVTGNALELIGPDTVVFSRVAASGTGENATDAELGAGIGNLIRASGDHHRSDKLYEEALKAISADTQGSAATVPPLPASPAPAAPPSSRQVPGNVTAFPSAQSIDTLEEQATSGDANAQSLLLWLYENDGQAVPQDHARAAAWWRKAADQENAGAQFMLGRMYMAGTGVPQDYSQTAAWYRKAADHGVAEAQSQLGWLYANGHGVQQDDAQAAGWYRKAAEQGVARAQLQLGLLYWHGSGVPQDYEEAYFWLDLAAAEKIEGLKQDDINEFRDEASSHLTTADLSLVQERARKWFEDHLAKQQ